MNIITMPGTPLPQVGNNIPIIGQQPKTWTYGFIKQSVADIKDIPTLVQRLLYVFMPPLPDGNIEVCPVAMLVQSPKTIELVKNKAIIACKREALVSLEEVGIDFDFGNAADEVDTPLDSTVTNGESA